jgi:hypothetical protein
LLLPAEINAVILSERSESKDPYSWKDLRGDSGPSTAGSKSANAPLRMTSVNQDDKPCVKVWTTETHRYRYRF